MPTGSPSPSSPSSNVDRSDVERIWSEHPKMPRAVASLMHFLEVDEEVVLNLQRGEREIAASLLADSYVAKEAFTREYRTPWRVAKEMFAETLQHAARMSGREAGDEVLFALPKAMLYRFGYVDGLRGAIKPDASRRTGAEGAAPSSQEVAAAGVISCINEVLGIAYDRGRKHGSAERRLRCGAPDALREIDEWVAAGMHGAGDANRRLLRLADCRHVTAPLAARHPEFGGALDVYARAHAECARAHLAHASIVRHMRAAGPLRSLSAGVAMRMIATERRRRPEGSVRPDVSVVLDDLLREAYIALSLFGYGPRAVAAFATDAEPMEVTEIATQSSWRSPERGRLYRRAMRGLSTKPPGGRMWALPCSGATVLAPTHAEVPLPEVDLSAWAHRRSLVRSVLRGGAGAAGARVGAEVRDVLDLGERSCLFGWRTGDGIPPHATVAADLLASLTRLPRKLHAPLRRFAMLERESATGADMPGALAERVSESVARRILRDMDDSGYRQVKAECEMVARGADEEIETAERWCRAYTREALALERDLPEHPEDGECLSEAGVEARLLHARARVLSGVLNERATREARALLASHLSDAGWQDHESPEAADAIRQNFEKAAREATRSADGAAGDCPLFVARLRRAIPAVALNWYAGEVSVIRDLRRRAIET